ncbi:MAG: ribosome small subunit-dependent GTPase A [Luminiphilus sp.]|jgi:ribosome biogenesis GTPase|nr:ribosome small subunit-dependent GTPase A [Luminiphilus sp.]
MGNRRLTDRQRRQIEQNAAKRRESSLSGEGEDSNGIIIARFSKAAIVMDENNDVHRCHLRPNLAHLVAGDRVLWQKNEQGGVVSTQLERQSEIKRPDVRGQLKAVAANVDLIVIVIAPEPEPFGNLIDRYLVAAYLAGIDTVIALNKSDLVATNKESRALLKRYETIGHTVIETGPDDQSTSALNDLLGDQTAVFVGQSGVGKSSMINRLIPDQELRVGALSESVLKGKHTTTTTEVFLRPEGGLIIDSPGIREFGLQHVAPEDVAPGFKEFHPYIDHCKYRDCRHLVEQGCAVLAALEAGSISKERYDSFVNIVKDIDTKSH